MACMYKLFNRVPDGMKTMLNHISEHLKNQGKDLVTEDDNVPKNPVHYVTVRLTRVIVPCAGIAIVNVYSLLNSFC